MTIMGLTYIEHIGVYSFVDHYFRRLYIIIKLRIQYIFDVISKFIFFLFAI